MEQTPLNRLNYSGPIDPVIERLCSAYEIGQPSDHSVIEIGYEDCNIIIETPKGKFVAKIFYKDRKPEQIARYGTILEKVVEAGINHPPLVKISTGETVYIDTAANGISMVLMRFIDGKTFMELNRAPDAQERRAILQQAAKV